MPWNGGNAATFLIDTGVNVLSPVNLAGTYTARARVSGGVVYGNSPGAGQYSHDYQCEAACLVSEASYMNGAAPNLASDPLNRDYSGQAQLLGVAYGRLYVLVRVTATNVNDSVVSLRPDRIEWRVDRLT